MTHTAEGIEAESALVRAQLITFGADVRRDADPTAILSAAKNSFKRRVDGAPSFLKQNATPISMVALGGAFGAAITGLLSRSSRTTSAAAKVPQIAARAPLAVAPSLKSQISAALLSSLGVGLGYAAGMFVPTSSTEEQLLSEPKAVLAQQLDAFLENHTQGMKMAVANLFGVSRLSAVALVGLALIAETLGENRAAIKIGANVNTTSAFRLTLAYLLIAASKADANTAGAAGEPAAAAGAASPTGVPARGWIDVARSVAAKIGKNRVLAVAAGLAFYGILAIFPAVTALVSVYGLFADPATIQPQLQHLSGVLPDGAISVIGEQVHRIAAQGQRTLGFAFITGVVIALWSANAGLKALFDALNVAYESDETRGFLRLNAITLVFTVSLITLAFVGLSLALILPWLLEHIFFKLAFLATIVRWLSAPIAIVSALLMLALLYRFGPAIKKPEWRWITPGSLFAATLLIVSSALFAYYTAHFGNYNETYGTLGAAIGFMTWLWISSIVVMIGAEINAEVEREANGEAPAADKTASRSA